MSATSASHVVDRRSNWVIGLVRADVVPRDLWADGNRCLDCVPGDWTPGEGPHELKVVIMS